MAAFTLLLIGVFVTVVSSMSTGPPLAACGTLTPGHNSSTNNVDPPPYRITVSSAMYAPGDDITVTIEQTSVENDFRGFIIQARRTSGDMDAPIGTFKDPPVNTQLLGCTPAGSTWAHSAATDKTSVTAAWTAPSSDEGTLSFRATIVVQNSGETSTFYENIMSEDLTYNGSTEVPAMMTSGNPSGPTEVPAMMTSGNPSGPTEASAMMTSDEDGDDDDGTGMIQASLLLTVMTLLIISLLTRRL